ncbi:unnamed protein product [Anisakis simplex]|uniref:Uncharacterized protein n=1 Tax=Anisakis simplex TaxID=6269 RepID=A0A0M3JAX2_ANISI|nr:unnamed protein product [Anisakis simplex]
MSEITPIIIRLEIEKSAPFFKLEFSTTDDNAESIEEPLRIALSSTAKTMLASKRRNKKATVTTAQQSATTAPSIAPVLGEDCSNGRGALPPIAADPRPQNTVKFIGKLFLFRQFCL